MFLFCLACRGTPKGPPPPSDNIIRESVKIISTAGVELEGELTLPANMVLGERRPGIVLIHGSGPVDKDESIPASLSANGQPARLFAQLADDLTRAGFIVLRYNKRGVLKPIEDLKADPQNPEYVDPSIWKKINRHNLISDVDRAVAFLRTDGRVDGVSLLGHSEGTMIAPIIAMADPSIRSLILLSAVGRNLKDVLYFQTVERNLIEFPRLMDKDSDGFVTPEEVPERFKASVPFEILDTDKDNRVSMAELQTYLENQWKGFEDTLANGEDTEIFQGFPKGWYRSWFQAEPNLSLMPRLRDLPILIVQGEDDQQTPFESEAKALYQAMVDSGHKNTTLKSYANLGHGFSPRNDGVPTLGPIEPQVIQDITNWARATLFPAR